MKNYYEEMLAAIRANDKPGYYKLRQEACDVLGISKEESEGGFVLFAKLAAWGFDAD